MAAWGKRVSAASSVGDFGEARVRSIEFRLFFATLHEKPLDDKHVEVRGLAAHGSVAAPQHADPSDLGEARVRSIEFRLFFATLHEKPLDDKHVEVRGLAAHGSVAARQHADPAELGPEGTPSASGLADYSSRRRNS